MRAMEILFPFKHWCGESINDKHDLEFHDCDHWEPLVLEQEANEKL
jgi:hypothetical protein